MATQSLQVGRHMRARDAGVRALWWREYLKPHVPLKLITRDGVEIRGVHFNNDHPTLLVYCHGFSAGKNMASIARFVQEFSAKLDVIAFDFRGHGESGGATTFGDKELFDLDALIQYAEQFHYRRVVLMGSSMGGAVAIRYTADSPAVHGVVTMGAFAHKQFSPMAMAGLGVLQWSVSRHVVHRSIPLRIERALPAYDPRDFAARIHPRPFMIMHGERDPLIPVAHARELYANAGEPKTLCIFPRGGHDLENLDARCTTQIGAWLERTI